MAWPIARPGAKPSHVANARHTMLAYVPDCRYRRTDQSTGKYSTCLQRAETENIARMCRVVAPVVDDVQNLGANNAAQNNHDAEIPGVIRINSLLAGVADADP